jgi:hypothetical protein
MQQRAAGVFTVGDDDVEAAATGIASLQDMFEKKRDVYRGILGDPAAQREGAQADALFAIANFGLQLAGATGGRVGATFGEKLAQAAEGSKVLPTISGVAKNYRDANQKFDLAALGAAESERTAALAAEDARALAAAKAKPDADMYQVVNEEGEPLALVNLKTSAGQQELRELQASYPGLDLWKVGTRPSPTAMGTVKQYALRADVTAAESPTGERIPKGTVVQVSARNIAKWPVGSLVETSTPTTAGVGMFNVYGPGEKPGEPNVLLTTLNLESPAGRAELLKLQQTHGSGKLDLRKVATDTTDTGGSGKAADQRYYSLPVDVAERLGVPASGYIDMTDARSKAIVDAAGIAKQQDERNGLFTITTQPEVKVEMIQLLEDVIDPKTEKVVHRAGDTLNIDKARKLGIGPNAYAPPNAFNPLISPTLLAQYAAGQTTTRQNMLIEEKIDTDAAERSEVRRNSNGVDERISLPGKAPSEAWQRAIRTREARRANLTLPSWWRSLTDERQEAIPQYVVGSGNTVNILDVQPSSTATAMPGMSGPGTAPVVNTESVDFNRFLFDGGSFLKRIDTDSPQWEMVPGMANDEFKRLRGGVARIGGLSGLLPGIVIPIKDAGRELGLGPGLDENDRAFQGSRRLLSNIQGRALTLITQAEGDQDRILKTVQDVLLEQVKSVKASTFTTDETTRNALQGLEDLFAASLKRLANVLPEFEGDPSRYTEKQITGAREDVRSIKSLLSDIILVRRSYEAALGTANTGAGGRPTTEGVNQTNELLNRLNEQN